MKQNQSMYESIKQGEKIGLQLNQCEYSINVVQEQISEIQNKIVGYTQIINKLNVVQDQAQKNVQKSNIIKNLELKQQAQRIYNKKTIEISEEESKIELKEIQSTSYDHPTEQTEERLKIYESEIKKIQYQQQKQMLTYNELNDQKSKQEQDQLSQYFYYQRIIDEVNAEISQKNHEIKNQDDKQKMQEAEKIYIQQCKNEEQRIQKENQDRHQSEINQLEQKKTKLGPQLEMKEQTLMKEEKILMDSKEILIELEKEEIKVSQMFRSVTKVLIALLFILISQYLRILFFKP